MKTLMLTTAAALICGSAQAADVYPGCAVPTTKTHKTFWVDPAKGSMKGDGSAAKPWHTLAEVLDPANKLIATRSNVRGTIQAVNANAPVQAGDIILLNSGDHGSPDLQNMFNTDFITVAGAPGQTPVVHFLSIRSATKWVFQGIKFQGQFPTGGDRNKLNGLIRIGYGEWQGASGDIVLSSNSISATDNTNNWSASDWQTLPYSDAVYGRAPCISVVGNHIYNVNNGVYMQADNGLFKGNLVENFFTDAFDMVGSNLTVQSNTIRNNTSTSDVVLHPDAVQGWALNGVTNKNLVVDSNTIVRKSDNTGGWMQGITIFDGKWDGVTITNNSIATNAWHGINLAGVANAKIVNNTVVATGSDPIWIKVTPSKDSIAAASPIVRNNMAPQILISGTNVTADHNLASKAIAIPASSGNAVYSGSVGDHNTVSANLANGFVTVDTKTGSFDLRLKSTSPAIGFGSTSLAPKVDLTGKLRTTPDDVGAYNH